MFLAKLLLNYLFLKDIAVIIDLFNQKNMQNGVILHCYNYRTALLMHKTFHMYNMKILDKRVDKNNHFKLKQYYQKVGIVVNTSCEGWNKIFDSFDTKDVFKSPFVWVILTENVTEATEILFHYRIELDSDVTVVVKKENIHVLFEMYYTGFLKRGQVIVREIGQWNKTLHIDTKHRRDLKGLVVRSTVVILQNQSLKNKTFVRYLDEEVPDLIKTDPIHKTKFYTPLKYFQDMFNITYDLQRTKSWGYGTNGSFDGMVGALQRWEADIGGSPIFIRSERAPAIDYAAEVWPAIPRFIFRHPKHPSGFNTIYTRPLTTRVWYCIIALVAVSTVVLGVLLKLPVIKLPQDDEDMSLSLAFLFIWSAVCQQGMSIKRNSLSVKVVVFVTFIFTLTLYQYYNATVVSTLLRELPKNIRTSKDLLKSHLKAGVEDILYNKDSFKRTTDPIALEIYHKKVVHTASYNYFSAEEGMALVKEGGFAFHIDRAVAYRIMRRTFSEKELCDIQEVMLFEPMNTGVAVAKRSPYKEIVAYGIRRMKESGILSRLISLWDEPRPACVRTPDSSVFSVTLQEFSSALIVLTVGYFAALMVLAGEILVWRLERKKFIEFRH